MKEVIIASACRTPIAKFQGGLTSFTAPKLGALAMDGRTLREPRWESWRAPATFARRIGRACFAARRARAIGQARVAGIP